MLLRDGQHDKKSVQPFDCTHALFCLNYLDRSATA